MITQLIWTIWTLLSAVREGLSRSLARSLQCLSDIFNHSRLQHPHRSHVPTPSHIKGSSIFKHHRHHHSQTSLAWLRLCWERLSLMNYLRQSSVCVINHTLSRRGRNHTFNLIFITVAATFSYTNGPTLPNQRLLRYPNVTSINILTHQSLQHSRTQQAWTFSTVNDFNIFNDQWFPTFSTIKVYNIFNHEWLHILTTIVHEPDPQILAIGTILGE